MADNRNLKTGFVRHNGAKLYYEAIGVGPAVVLLHAGITDLTMWNAQIAPLQDAGLRVLRFDLRGCGQSDADGSPYSHADDLRAVLDHTGIDGAALVGCSMGGTAALDFALSHPARARQVVMVCAGPSGYQHAGDLTTPLQWEQAVEAWQAGNIERAGELELSVWLGGAPDPELLRRVLASYLPALEREKAGTLGEERPLEPPAVGRLAEVSAPTLLISGALDLEVVRRQIDLLAQGITGAQHVTIADAAHLPPLEQPEAFNAALLGFLR